MKSREVWMIVQNINDECLYGSESPTQVKSTCKEWNMGARKEERCRVVRGFFFPNDHQDDKPTKKARKKWAV